MKKHISFLTLCLFLAVQTISSAQEGTKIPFKNGTLKICSTKSFTIKGHDGNNVIIKNLSNGIASNNVIVADSLTARVYSNYSTKNRVSSGLYTTGSSKGIARTRSYPSRGYYTTLKGNAIKNNDSVFVGFLHSNKDQNRSKGLKKLGKKAAAEESGIYLKIEQKDGELIISDDLENLFVMTQGEKYEITIPNSISLNWDTSGCSKKTKSYFFRANGSEIMNFKGEVEITSSLNNFKLTDVSGPVSVNTIGGNVTVIFDKTTPNKLYSVYSNNGFIDITLPKSSSITVDATASEILSDLDFKILSESNKNHNQQMNLKLGNGNVKMKLDADLGNIYLRGKKN